MVTGYSVGELLDRHNLRTADRRISWQFGGDLQEVKLGLWRCIVQYCRALGIEPKSVPQYAEVADWLYCNDGKGLLIYGNCGLGKSLLISKILPACCAAIHAIILGKCYSAYDLARPEVLNVVRCRRVVVLDDIGTESWGNFHEPAVPIVVDGLEKNDGLLVATTNLTGEQMYDRYGERVVDRIAKLCKIVHLEGTSFRE